MTDKKFVRTLSGEKLEALVDQSPRVPCEVRHSRNKKVTRRKKEQNE